MMRTLQYSERRGRAKATVAQARKTFKYVNSIVIVIIIIMMKIIVMIMIAMIITRMIMIKISQEDRIKDSAHRQNFPESHLRTITL